MNSMGKVSDKQIEQMNNVADIDSMHLLDLVSRLCYDISKAVANFEEELSSVIETNKKKEEVILTDQIF